MIESKSSSDVADNHSDQNAGKQSVLESGQKKSSMSKSMHDGVEVWCDCCSCEAEPYWVEAMESSQDTGK